MAGLRCDVVSSSAIIYASIFILCWTESRSFNNPQNFFHELNSRAVQSVAHDDDVGNNKFFSTDRFSISPLSVTEAISSENQVLKRKKRKVVPRGGHYIVRSRMGGGTPWGSKSTYGDRFEDLFGPGARRKKKARKGSGSGTFRNLPKRNKFPSGETWSDATYGSPTKNRAEAVRRLRMASKYQRKTISKNLKDEIAQYALRHGPKKTAERYAKDIGRKLKERVILKFVARYKKRKANQRRKADKIQVNSDMY